MREIFSAIDRWSSDNNVLALATVINTWGSSPRGISAKMLVNAEGEMAGSVSGGCVEGAVVEVAMEVIQTGIPQRLHFGVSDETAWEVGLACGGEIEVFVRLLDNNVFEALKSGWERGEPSVLCVVIKGTEDYLGHEILYHSRGRIAGNISYSHLEVIDSLAMDALNRGTSSKMMVTLMNGVEDEIFIDVIPSPPVFIIIGGVHIAIPLVAFANTLGFQTIVIDPRRKFGSPDRFKHAAQVINGWPQKVLTELNLSPSTAVAVLSHDPKIDDPALETVLSSSAFYVGALGSKKTQSARRERLLASGLTEIQVNRIKGPIGLDLGARSPEEIALAIMADIIKEKNIL